jgi:hypothetical protein
MDAVFDGSAAGVAVIVTIFGEGASAGATNVAEEPLPAIVPHVAPEQPAPEIVQLIAGLGFEFATGVRVDV